jgi:hypothetical protein
METPTRLIGLLQQLLAETDKINIGKRYIAITEEVKSITFVDNNAPHSAELVYKHLIRLAIKDYIHSGHSQDSIKVLNDIMTIISDSEIRRN